MIYLDNNATTAPDPASVRAVREGLEEHWANPSSVHRPGQEARHRIELAREAVARLIGAQAREIVFTSGGTESIDLALAGSCDRRPGRPVVVTNRLEHAAVRGTAERLERQGREVVWLETGPGGIVRTDHLEDLLRRRGGDVAVVSVMGGNNETGVLQPVDEIGAVCRGAGVPFHCDAVQLVGKVPVDVGAMPVDLLSFSAHKLHGPKGVGALWVRRGVHIAPRLTGGPQERERRAGTENVPGILGFGAAAASAGAWLDTPGRAAGERLRDRLERRILDAVDDAVINGGAAPRLWNTSNIGFPRLEAEAMLLLLSERGVCASAGAACSSGSLDPSPVLLAMGVEPAVAHGSIRFSLSRDTTEAEIDGASALVVEAVERLRASLV